MNVSKCLAVLALPLALAGCEITPENSYAKAGSIEECYNYAVREQVQRRNSRASSINTGSSEAIAAGLAGLLIGTAISHDINKTRLEQCVKRFGGTQQDIDALTAQRRAKQIERKASPKKARGTAVTPARTCTPGAGVLHGGSGYCSGY